jgi:hypothetical protein
MPAVAAFLVGPVAVAFIARLVTSRGSWSPDLLLLLVALIALFVAVRFATRSQKPKDAEAPYQRLSEVENENWQLAIAVALVVTAELVAVAAFEFWAGVGLTALVLAWALVWSLPQLRRIEARSSVQAACTPEAAFALVSDPHSWRLWTPELETVESSDVPVRVGTVVRSRARVQGQLIEMEERVTVFDPPRRCSSELLGVRGVSDMYEIAATEGGSLITYEWHFLEPLSQAPFGGALFRRNFVKRRRKKAMLRIKQLLEDDAAGSV